MQLLNIDCVIIFDWTDFGKSNLSLSDGKCSNDKVDCIEHSAEYDVLSKRIRPFTVQTNVWCSASVVTSDGSLTQAGGFNDSEHRVRIFKACKSTTDNCDWVEVENALVAKRWYTTNHILPNGRQIVIGGRGQFNYKFLSKNGAPNLYNLPSG
ncbi:hypothetical protein Dsin_022022 [Dipteronia sinensis]|uniref:Glyoxal oxidase N-terminal domain-containing protein n=1 Tax=Dipteronia sinensis TaxID=43782 RepID=A0AAE0A1Q0_9ROSI|nr:hypothetical protein Dsin_022022 [Dipteronia sinensis]